MKLENLIKTECNILQFDTLPSTNDTAKELGLRGEKENTAVIARAQTAGRGRMGRQFFSPDQSGIYMSILLRPTFSPDKSHLLTPAAAVAVADAIDSVCGTDCKIKWVNDIYLGNKKVCGILTETSPVNNVSVLPHDSTISAAFSSMPKTVAVISSPFFI